MDYRLGSLVVFALILTISAPFAQAAPGPSAKLDCHGKPGSTASVTWWWTIQGRNQTGNPSTTLNCTVGADGKGSASTTTTGRPPQATDFHFVIKVTPAGKGTTTCGPVARNVTPGFGFAVHDHCQVKDPTSARYVLNAP